MRATSGARASSIKRYGEETGARALPRHARRLRDGQAAHRRRGDRLRLPRGRPPRARLRRIARARPRATSARASPRSGVATLGRSRARSIREEIGSDAYHGALVVPGSALRPSGPLLRGARRRRRSGRRRPARGRPRPADPPPGGRPVRRRDRAWRDPRPRRPRRHEWLHRWRRARRLRRRIIPIGSYIIASEPLPDDLVADISPKGRAFFDTKNFLYYWHISADRRMVFGGRASFLPIVDRADRRDPLSRPAPRSIRSWPAGGSTTPGAATSGSRSTGCRTPAGRRTASPTRWAAAGPASR